MDVKRVWLQSQQLFRLQYLNRLSSSKKEWPGIKSMYESRHLSDIYIYTDRNLFFLCHKNILKQKSPVLATMISDAKEDDELHIPETEAETFEYVLEYIYSGEIRQSLFNGGLPVDHARIAVCASRLGLADLYQAAIDRIVDYVDRVAVIHGKLEPSKANPIYQKKFDTGITKVAHAMYIMFHYFEDREDVGCAMLVGWMRRKGILGDVLQHDGVLKMLSADSRVCINVLKYMLADDGAITTQHREEREKFRKEHGGDEGEEEEREWDDYYGYGPKPVKEKIKSWEELGREADARKKEDEEIKIEAARLMAEEKEKNEDAMKQAVEKDEEAIRQGMANYREGLLEVEDNNRSGRRNGNSNLVWFGDSGFDPNQDLFTWAVNSYLNKK